MASKFAMSRKIFIQKICIICLGKNVSRLSSMNVFHSFSHIPSSNKESFRFTFTNKHYLQT